MTLAIEQKFPRLLSEAQSFTNQMVEHFWCLKMSLDEENDTNTINSFSKTNLTKLPFTTCLTV